MTALQEQLARSVGFDLPARYNASRLLWDNLPHNAARPALFHDTGQMTYGALVDLAGRFGSLLRARGCVPGDRVLLLLEDEPAYPAVIMGAMRAGLVPMMINCQSPVDLITYFLQDSQATAAVFSPAFGPLLKAAVSAAHTTIAIIPSDTQALAGADPHLPEAPTRRDDMAFWMYSSGSTGRPKGVVHKHEDAAYTAQTYARHILDLSPDDICFSIPKIYFAYGFGNSVTFPMQAGAAAVLISGRPTPARCFDAISHCRPTVLFGLPTLYTALMADEAAEMADLSSVRLCLSAAEILSKELSDSWQRRFGHRIIEGLGSTEMLHIYLSNCTAQHKQGAAGQVVPGYRVRLVDSAGQQVAPGDEGVMEVCGLSGARFYWNSPDKTAETMRDGWINTGDRFTCDAQGFYSFRGRADDLVKVSGQWVYPLEIERALAEHPGVREVCVQAVPCADRRMTLIAWVAPKNPQDEKAALAADLKAFAKSTLLPHKYPRQIHFMDALPKTGTDKIDRQALKAAAGAPGMKGQ